MDFDNLTTMNVEQYAKVRKVSKVAVTRAINLNKSMIGVALCRKIGRDWFLDVDKKEAEKKPKKCLVIRK